jgi:hypothetical protein
MLDVHSQDLEGIDRTKLAECIQACFDCAQTCTACADACLNEDMVAELTNCIRTNLDCVDISAATGRILSRQAGIDTGTTRSMLEACRTACRVCAEECGKHASIHRHCELCAEACRRCERACAELLVSLRWARGQFKMGHPRISRPARRARQKEQFRVAGHPRPSADPQLRHMLTSHVHCGQEMQLIIVHPAPAGRRTIASNDGGLLTYRCACGFSFDQRRNWLLELPKSVAAVPEISTRLSTNAITWPSTWPTSDFHPDLI